MLPEAFKNRMKALLGPDADAFFDAEENGSAERAFRINGVKVGEAQTDAVLRALADFSPEKIPYVASGYRFTGEKIGNTPAHHAGAIYVQDPGAMMTLAAVDVPRGARVVDFCAAPGGKSTQLAAMIGEEGILFSNEYVPARAKITVGNFERLGLRSAVLTSVDTAVYRDLFSAYFDVAVVDAPCSGEGMFRKNDLAVSEWSEENVRRCAERQAEILDNAAPTVRAGGLLVYSTCTYSIEENEMTVAAFLDRHPDYTLVPPHDRILPFTAPGIKSPDVKLSHPEYCRRFYPHLTPGEGQFVAVLRRDGCDDMPRILYKNVSKAPDKAMKSEAEALLRDTVLLPDGYEVRTAKDGIFLLPAGLTLPPVPTFLSGVRIAEVKGKILLPHHQFASAFGDAYVRKIDLSFDDGRLSAYLRGEEIPTDGAPGFSAVLAGGIALGGGKVSGGMLKNHYPKGLRLPH